MNQDLVDTLNALYCLEQEHLLGNVFDQWATPADVAARLPAEHPHHGDSGWTRKQLEGLWLARKVLQVSQGDVESMRLEEVRLLGLERHGDEDGRLRLEANDVRGWDVSDFAQAALFGSEVAVRYRSRVAELARLLSLNYQRYRMAPATGVLRYERRPQQRPKRQLAIDDLVASWRTDILAGHIRVATPEHDAEYPLRRDVRREDLARAMEAAMKALAERLGSGRANLARFQATSIMTTLAGLYSDNFRERFDAHVVTAGVGSGKSYAFQIGALIHAAYTLLIGKTGLRILLLYPRVVLAANQFQDLTVIATRVGELLQIPIRSPLLDAGGQLQAQMGIGGMEAGGLFKAIQGAYGSGEYSIIISNLDTLANRIGHPEATRGLVKDLDLVVCDEVHLLSGLYGSHARMLLKRMLLLRTLWQARTVDAGASFSRLLARRTRARRPYMVGASATIAHPAQHTCRLIATEQARVMVVGISDPEDTGWVHHMFLQQRPEVSTMTALVNATACTIHNRRDGVFREYYQKPGDGSEAMPLALSDLPNPIQAKSGEAAIVPREPEHLHKTLGFCDSLDGVGRWADLVTDNERTKGSRLTSPSPGDWKSYPYFARFQEPLWRVVHQRSFAKKSERWQEVLRQHYGGVCRSCKKGVSCSVARVPDGLSEAGKREVGELWSDAPSSTESYLHRLGVAPELRAAEWFTPVREAGRAERVGSLERCAFFQTGLCWWWSLDHAGSNAPAPPSIRDPLNGVKMATARDDGQHHYVNGIRLLSFTSQKHFDMLSLRNINYLYRGTTSEILRDRKYAARPENGILIVGSPRLEVGVDLSRVMDGITYRAMRDPSSLQQKVGRVGRELASDAVLVHMVTMNARDQYYFRSPQIALDPDYLQALPLHEDNRIVARHHLLMAIVDFLAMQGAEPGSRAIGNGGDRVALVNDHARPKSFSGWDQKVVGVYEFLFGTHPHQGDNLANLTTFLQALGAEPHDLANPEASAKLKPTDAPGSVEIGVIDVFRHEFGPNFLLTPLTAQTGDRVTLAQLAAVPYEPPVVREIADLPRHAAFLSELRSVEEKPHIRRSYLRDLLCWPMFRRGLPERSIPGDHPFVWTPNLFEAVGTETVGIVEEVDGRLRPVSVESVSTALALLPPGAVTYRYGDTPRKVLVSRHHAAGQPTLAAPGIQRVALCVENPQFFEPASDCDDVDGDDLPQEFFGSGPIRIFTPRQLVVGRASSQPLVLRSEGMMADGDSRTVPVGAQAGDVQEVMTPPRYFALQWFRVRTSASDVVTPRFQRRLARFAGGREVPAFPTPAVLKIFRSISYDSALAVTSYVWGLDRQFMSRGFDAARLVYRASSSDNGSTPVALGHKFLTPGVIFAIDTSADSKLERFLTEFLEHPESAAYQSLLPQFLGRFLALHGRVPLDAAAPWLGKAQASVFAVRNLRAIVLFHLLRCWHPAGGIAHKPGVPPVFSLEDFAACFHVGHPNYLTTAAFDEICSRLADLHEPPSVIDHAATLRQTRVYFDQACENISAFNAASLREVARDLLLNSMGLAMHEAGLRLSGAEAGNLGYFYKRAEGEAHIFLFDTDAQGNGTAELIRDNIFIPNAERALVDRLRMLGNIEDPLPSRDYARCLEDGLQECASSHAAHLAYHCSDPSQEECWRTLRGEYRGERSRAGVLYDFLRKTLGIASFDQLGVLHESPEFVAQLSEEYGRRLVGSAAFPAYQALESALGFCLSGCIACVLSPEANLHGSLNAKDSVNKLVLDAFYRWAVCEPNEALVDVCYPGRGPARTVAWGEHVRAAAGALGRDAGAFRVELLLPTGDGTEQSVSLVTPTVTYGGEAIVFRSEWGPASAPKPTVRIRMEF